MAARIAAVSAEQDAGAIPPGLMFPAPAGGYWRSPNFRRRVPEAAYQAAGGGSPLKASAEQWEMS